MTAGRCAWPRPCDQPTEDVYGLLEYCYEHGCEVAWNRDHPLVEVDARTNARGDIQLDDPDAEDAPRRERVNVGEVLTAYLALPAKTQFKRGHAMRQSRSKVGEYHELPTCARCARSSVFDPCRRCSPDSFQNALRSRVDGSDRAATL